MLAKRENRWIRMKEKKRLSNHVLLSLQVFIWGITDTKILTVTYVRACVSPFMLFPIIQGVNGVFESRE